ncbi:hypothetical protein [Lysinibacillus sp. NPDC056232]
MYKAIIGLHERPLSSLNKCFLCESEASAAITAKAKLIYLSSKDFFKIN